MPTLRGNKRKTEDDDNLKATAKPKQKRGKQAVSTNDTLGLAEVQKDGNNPNKSGSIQLVKDITQESPAKGKDDMASAVMGNRSLDTQTIPENLQESFHATNPQQIYLESNQHKVKLCMEIDEILNNDCTETAVTVSPVEVTSGASSSQMDLKVEKVITLNSEPAPEEKKMETENSDDVQIKEATCSLPLLMNNDPPQKNHLSKVQELVSMDNDKEVPFSNDNDYKPESVDEVNIQHHQKISYDTDKKEKVTMRGDDSDVASITCNSSTAEDKCNNIAVHGDETEGPGLLQQLGEVKDAPMTAQFQPHDACIIIDQKDFLEMKNITMGFEKDECKLPEDCLIPIEQGDVAEEKSLEIVTCPDKSIRNIVENVTCPDEYVSIVRNIVESQGKLESDNLSPQQNETVVNQEDDLVEKKTTLEKKVQANNSSESSLTGEINKQSCANVEGNTGGEIKEVLDENMQENEGTHHMLSREQLHDLNKNFTKSKENYDSTQPFELNVMENEIEKLTQKEIIENFGDKQQLGDYRMHGVFDELPVLETEVRKSPEQSLKETNKKSPELGSNEIVVNKGCQDENNAMSMKSGDLSESQLCELVADNFDMNMLDDEQLQDTEEDMAFGESLSHGKARAVDAIDKMIVEGEQGVQRITGELSLINKQLLKMKRRIEMARQVIAQVPVPQENRSRFSSLGSFGFFK
ncbi:unnamed protein product [Lymnaea stagnalis]|uniref:Uncharacterized protein n=1 Tax=Lymnaea stagnalis TaxID=6523 RepID=A0AAV2H158_LYMST